MKRLRGFSLVELMVAITLALIVTTGVISVFIGSRSAFQATSGVAALSDSGRFALTFLENAVRNSGFMACAPASRTTNNLGPESSNLFYGPFPSGFFAAMSGFEAANTGAGSAYASTATPGTPANWTPNLDAAFATLPSQPIANSDILVVRSSDQSSQASYVNAPPVAASFTVDAPRQLATSKLAIISDCSNALIFQITAIAGTLITHDIGGSPGNQTQTFPFNFGQGSLVTPLATTVYYIGVGADGDGALFSADIDLNNKLTPNELVPGVEAMQILYGVDANGTQSVSKYVTADLVLDFNTVLSVQVALLVAGPAGSATTPAAAPTYSLLGTTVTAPIDTRVRQVFEVTIAARNALP